MEINTNWQDTVFAKLETRMEGEQMSYRSVKSGKLKRFLKVLIIFTVIISILTVTPLAAASDLDEFEEAATSAKTDQGTADEDKDKDKKDKEDKEDGVSQSLSEDEDVSLFGLFFGGFIEVIVEGIFSELEQGAKKSLARVDEDKKIDTREVEIRRTGEPTLPFLQYEHNYVKVNSDIDARENGLEVGYGPIGFSCRQTDFREEDPSDELTLNYYHLLLRISGSSSGELGIGIGSLVMDGNDDHSGFSITFPIKFYPGDSLGFRFKPTFSWINGNSIDEYDLSLAYTIRYASIQLGYRFLEAEGKELNGSYFGFAAHY